MSGSITTVGQGESVPSIAKDNGFFWKTIWEHSDNAELKSRRADPNILYEGDEVFVPDLEKKKEPGATEATHVFKRKGDPLKFRLQLLRGGTPRKNIEFTLDIDGKLIKGKTDGSGWIDEWIPGNACGGTLTLSGGKESYPVSISRLDPYDTISGAQQRLGNLGFGPGSPTGEMNDRTSLAVRSFQEKNGLPVNGLLDDATKSRLKSLHP